MDHRALLLAPALALLLAGCAPRPDAEAPPQVAAAEDQRPEPRPGAAEEEAAPAAAAAPAGALGRTVASLGSPAEGGLWLVTGLVTAPGPGVVTHLSSGARAEVELRPSGEDGGAGGRMSVAAFQALGLPLTALPTLEVARR